MGGANQAHLVAHRPGRVTAESPLTLTWWWSRRQEQPDTNPSGRKQSAFRPETAIPTQATQFGEFDEPVGHI